MRPMRHVRRFVSGIEVPAVELVDPVSGNHAELIDFVNPNHPIRGVMLRLGIIVKNGEPMQSITDVVSISAGLFSSSCRSPSNLLGHLNHVTQL